MNMVFLVTSAKVRPLKLTKAGFGKGKNKSSYLGNADKSTWPVMTKINFWKFLGAQMLLLKHLPPRKLSGSLY